MSEEFEKENDYTLKVTSIFPTESKLWKSSLTRLFNFKSAQVTTLYRESVFLARGDYHSSGYRTGMAALTSQMHTDSMAALPSYEELKLMHEKLIELGGKPPELSSIVAFMDKKPHPL